MPLLMMMYKWSHCGDRPAIVFREENSCPVSCKKEIWMMCVGIWFLPLDETKADSFLVPGQEIGRE